MGTKSMRQFVHLAIPIAIVTAGALPAHATAGLSCRAEDPSLVLDVVATFGRSIGAEMLDFAATLEILQPRVPPDLRRLQFDRKTLHQIWWHEKDLKFHMHHARSQDEPYGYVDLVVETTQSDDNVSL